MPKTTNPRKIPRTQADVDKAYAQGFEDGMRDIVDIMVYTIGADMDMDDDFLDRFHERFIKNLDCHVNGELRTYDLRSALYAEKGWEVEITNTMGR